MYVLSLDFFFFSPQKPILGQKVENFTDIY